MFTPDLDLIVKTRCSKFSILDKTGVDTGDADKWSGIYGLNPANLTEATITIISPAGVETEYDVLSDIPSPVTGTFTFSDLTGTSVDGLHNLVYTLKTVDFSISAYSNYGTTVSGTVLVTAPTHGMLTGNYVEISSSTNYDGTYYVTRVDDNYFYITATYAGNDGASTGTIVYQSTFYPYVYCTAEAGIEKMFSGIAAMVAGATRDKYQADAITAWGLLQVLKSAISSSNTGALDTIQDEIDQILEYYDIDADI